MIVLSKNYTSKDILLVSCDFKISKKCRKKYKSKYPTVLANKNRNNGKIRCQECSYTLNCSGRNNPGCLHKDINDNLFKNIDIEFKAYLLGLICSDGTIAKNRITIELQYADKDILNKVIKELDKSLKLYKRTRIQKSGFISHMASLKINSKQWSKDICKHLGIVPGKKYLTIQFPKLKNNKLKWHFIRGCFDGDGWVRKHNKVKKRSLSCGIASNSIKFLLDLQSNILVYSKVSGCNLDINAKAAMDFLDRLYKNATIYLNRKHREYLIWKKLVPNKAGYYRA